MICEMKPVAHIRTDFSTKFGVPRQSGLADELVSRIVFEPEFRAPEMLRGIEGYSHLWLVWLFSENMAEGWSPTVRPPRLGGNVRMGVFATRSPFRPNPIGLSSVRLAGLEKTAEGTVLLVKGADLVDGTPILDIKPYLPYTDSHPDALGGFSNSGDENALDVTVPQELLCLVPEEKRTGLLQVLRQDPRPGFHREPDRIFGIAFAGLDIRFTVQENKLTVCGISEYKKSNG